MGRQNGRQIKPQISLSKKRCILFFQASSARFKAPKNYVIHSFRHSFRDRLRSIYCPSEIIDQIGGWSNLSVGTRYGSGYTLKNLLEVMHKI